MAQYATLIVIENTPNTYNSTLNVMKSMRYMENYLQILILLDSKTEQKD